MWCRLEVRVRQLTQSGRRRWPSSTAPLRSPGMPAKSVGSPVLYGQVGGFAFLATHTFPVRTSIEAAAVRRTPAPDSTSVTLRLRDSLLDVALRLSECEGTSPCSWKHAPAQCPVARAMIATGHSATTTGTRLMVAMNLQSVSGSVRAPRIPSTYVRSAPTPLATRRQTTRRAKPVAVATCHLHGSVLFQVPTHRHRESGGINDRSVLGLPLIHRPNTKNAASSDTMETIETPAPVSTPSMKREMPSSYGSGPALDTAGANSGG